MWCGWYDICRSVLVTRQVATVWVNCFVTIRCGWKDVSPMFIYMMDLSPVITLFLSMSCRVPLWRAATISTYVRFLQVFFRSIDVIAYVFCHAGVLVCLFVVTCEFLYDVIETWLSNSQLHYEILVPSFWL